MLGHHRLDLSSVLMEFRVISNNVFGDQIRWHVFPQFIPMFPSLTENRAAGRGGRALGGSIEVLLLS
jgi:hypothetical protein